MRASAWAGRKPTPLQRPYNGAQAKAPAVRAPRPLHFGIPPQNIKERSSRGWRSMLRHYKGIAPQANIAAGACILAWLNYDSVFASGADYDSHFWVDGGYGAAGVGVCVAGGFQPAAGAAGADSGIQGPQRPSDRGRRISDYWGGGTGGAGWGAALSCAGESERVFCRSLEFAFQP